MNIRALVPFVPSLAAHTDIRNSSPNIPVYAGDQETAEEEGLGVKCSCQSGSRADGGHVILLPDRQLTA